VEKNIPHFSNISLSNNNVLVKKHEVLKHKQSNEFRKNNCPD